MSIIQPGLAHKGRDNELEHLEKNVRNREANHQASSSVSLWSDRKKEIIVLSGGKNVLPAALEGKLAAVPLIAQACVVGDRRKHLAALLVPDLEKLGEELQHEGIDTSSPQTWFKNPKVKALYQKQLRQDLNRNLADYEAISAFRLIPTPFSQEAGEVTPTLKLRRKAILEHYRREVESMYDGG